MQAIEQAIITHYDLARLEEMVNDCLHIYRTDGRKYVTEYMTSYCPFLTDEQITQFSAAIIQSSAIGVISVQYSEVTE